MRKAQPKGILSPDRQTLTWAQKQDYFRLINQGVEEKTARALALALNKRKSSAWFEKEIAKADATPQHLKPLHEKLQYTRRLNAQRGGDPKAMRQVMEDHHLALEALSKGNKPLGAAFSHGRKVARDKGGGKKKAKDAANAYLKRQGHAPIGKSGALTNQGRRVNKSADSSPIPPQAVQSACARGLKLAPEYGGQGLTSGAKSRARSMAQGKAVSPGQLRRMHSFFARHSSYEKQSSPPSPGYVSWLLWGGDAGKRWADSQVSKLEKSGTWDESLHPRTAGGEFGDGGKGADDKNQAQRLIAEHAELAAEAMGRKDYVAVDYHSRAIKHFSDKARAMKKSASADLAILALQKSAWVEADHPRDKDGEFSDGDGGGESYGGGATRGKAAATEEAKQRALQGYQNLSYQGINAAAVKYDLGAKGLDDFEKRERQHVESLSQLAYDHKTQEPITVYRGFQVASGLKPGDVIAPHGFTSTSSSKAVANRFAKNVQLYPNQEKVVATIRVPKGVPVIDVSKERPNEKLSSSEKEFIFDHRQGFRVVEDKGKDKSGARQLVLEPVSMHKDASAVTAVKSGGRSKRLKKSKSSYHERFVEASRSIVPAYYFDKAHSRARGASGGDATAAGRKTATLDDLWQRRNALADELESLNATIDAHPGDMAKATAMQGQSHVDVPLGSDKPVKRRKKKALKKGFENDYNLQRAALVEPDAEIDQKLRNANRLIAGMDWEQRVGAYDVEDARARASRQLAQDLNYYDSKLQPDDSVRNFNGIDLDVASGQARAPGYLGLDLYPYDYGTAVHDVSLGLPVPDQNVRSLRLVNALDSMPDYSQDATPLLLEAQRALLHGGKLIYQGKGDLMDRADWSQLPGLVLVDHADTHPLYGDDEPSGSELHHQIFERVRVRVPRVFGADPTWLGADEEGPDDISYALTAMGGNASANRVMENLVNPSPPLPADIRFNGGTPIMAGKKWQRIIYCVVYAPNEMDHDGEYMDQADIEQMAHDAQRERVPIKVEHGGDPIGAHIVESYIAPADFTINGPMGPQTITQGSWVVAIQFTDDEEWQKVLSGQYRGISVGGRALYEQR